MESYVLFTLHSECYVLSTAVPKKYLQSSVATSRYALPFTATLISLIWVAVSVTMDEGWAQLGLFVASTVMMVALNDTNRLMRTYSRMVSCSFMVLYSLVSLPMPQLQGCIVTCCFIAYLLIVWQSYLEPRAPDKTFFAYLFLGIASTQWIHIVYLLPICWVLMWRYTNALSLRNMMGSIIGVLTPYWVLIPYIIYKGDYALITDHIESLTTFQQTDLLASVSLEQTVALAFVALLAMTGTIHFLRNASADKIRTRMVYQSLIWMVIVCIVLILLQPCHAQELGGIMTVCASPLIAHYIAYTHTRVTNISFVLMIVLTLVIGLLKAYPVDLLQQYAF